jgi:hypothetical protein
VRGGGERRRRISLRRDDGMGKRGLMCIPVVIEVVVEKYVLTLVGIGCMRNPGTHLFA